MMDFDEIVVKESPGLCRCCLSEGCYKDLGSEYSWMSETEIYADMLLECFDISISQHPSGPNGSNRLICEVCITRLRDACNFKKQVLESEKRFVDMVGRGEFRPKVLLYQTQMKTELSMDLEEETGADDPEVEYLEEDVDFVDEDLLKNEDYGEPSVSEDITVSALTVKGKRGRPKKTAVKPEKKAKVPKLEDKKTKAVAKDKSMALQKTAHDRHKLTQIRRNIRIILQHGNVMPFMWSRYHTYLCFYCKALVMNVDALREHVATMHQFVDLDSILFERIMNVWDCEVPVKLDVRDLSCKLCVTSIASIPDLITHLNDVHQAGYDTSIKDCLFSFELGKERLICSPCGLTFNHFEYLLRHAIRNHVAHEHDCTVCGKTFHRKMALVAHVNDYHKEGGYPCEICGIMWKSASRRYHHKKTVHLTYQRKCPVCDRVCKSKYYMRQHMTTTHGIQEYSNECVHCGKKFSLKGNMATHIRRVHYKERNSTCTVCGLRFFDKQRLERHMITHIGGEVCTCVVCGRSYQRKSTLRAHFRKAHSDVEKKLGQGQEICGDNVVLDSL